jgi:hypothetical protein
LVSNHQVQDRQQVVIDRVGGGDHGESLRLGSTGISGVFHAETG